MTVIFGILFFLCIVGLILGIVKPTLVIRWGELNKRTRKNVLKYYGIGLIVSFFGIGIFAPKTTNTEDKAANTQVENTKEEDQSEDKNQEEPKVEEQKEETPQVAPGITKEYIQSKLKNIEIENVEDGGDNYYTISFKAKDNFTNNMIKIGILDDIKEISKTLVDNNLVDDSKDFYFKAIGAGNDKYGNEVEMEYGQGLAKGSELLKCKFDGMTYDDMEKVMKSFAMHPSLR